MSFSHTFLVSVQAIIASAHHQKAFSNSFFPIRSTLSFNTSSLSLTLSPHPIVFLPVSLGPCLSHVLCPSPSASSFLISSLLFTPFDDTLWGIYYVHEAAGIQFYSFDETVRNLPLNFTHLTFS